MDPDEVPALELLSRAASSVGTEGTTCKEWSSPREPSSRSNEEMNQKKKKSDLENSTKKLVLYCVNLICNKQVTKVVHKLFQVAEHLKIKLK